MTDLFYRERGQGRNVILLHGFPFQQQLWDEFATKLATNFKLFTIDLPGFGKSKLEEMSFSIDDIGRIIAEWISTKDLTDVILIGHSLGGYVALAAANHDSENLSGLVLFHSTALADSEEKKQSRNKVIEFVNENGAEAFTSNFIAPLFSDQQHPAIPKVRAVAKQASADTVKGYTAAMRDRKDRTFFLKDFSKPVLFLAGEKDAGIPVQSVHEQASFCRDPQVHVLKNVAHMGMFENEPETLSVITDFIKKN